MVSAAQVWRYPRWLILLILGIILGLLVMTLGWFIWHAQIPPRRARPAPPDVPLIEQQALLLPDGRVLVYEGCYSCSTVRLYSPQADQWRVLPDGPQSRYGVAVLLANDEVLFVGTNRIYNPRADNWRDSAPMLFNHGDEFSATVLKDGRVLVVGFSVVLPPVVGQANTKPGRDPGFAEVYDPLADRWQTTAPSLRGHSGHIAIRLEDGRVLIAGGAQVFTSHPLPANYRRASELYDPQADHWTIVGDLAEMRYKAVATLLHDGRVLVIGGLGGTREAEAFDPMTSRWVSAGRLIAGHDGHTVTALIDGRVLVAGGRRAQNSNPPSSQVELYNPQSNSWSRGTPLTTERYGPTATLFPDGWVLFLGGSGPQTWKERLPGFGSRPPPSIATLVANTEWYHP